MQQNDFPIMLKNPGIHLVLYKNVEGFCGRWKPTGSIRGGNLLHVSFCVFQENISQSLNTKSSLFSTENSFPTGWLQNI